MSIYQGCIFKLLFISDGNHYFLNCAFCSKGKRPINLFFTERSDFSEFWQLAGILFVLISELIELFFFFVKLFTHNGKLLFYVLDIFVSCWQLLADRLDLKVFFVNQQLQSLNLKLRRLQLLFVVEDLQLSLSEPAVIADYVDLLWLTDLTAEIVQLLSFYPGVFPGYFHRVYHDWVFSWFSSNQWVPSVSIPISIVTQAVVDHGSPCINCLFQLNKLTKKLDILFLFDFEFFDHFIKLMIKVIVGFGEKILVFQILLSLAMKLLVEGFYF